MGNIIIAMIVVIGLIEHLILSVFYFAVIGLDIVMFFAVVRVLAMRWPKPWLVSLARVGSPVIDPLSRALGKTLHVASMRGQLALLLVAVMLCRLCLVAILRSVA